MIAEGIATAAGALTIRAAAPADIPPLERLILASARVLSRGFYEDREADAAITHMFGVDSELVVDGTYLVAERDGRIAGCGGWSRRRTLFGGDRYAERAVGLLDPAHDAARIRAFFVDPGCARAGVGTRLLAACEAAALAADFTRTALMATLPGVPFYARHRYVAGSPVPLDLGGVLVRFVPMEKTLADRVMLQK